MNFDRNSGPGALVRVGRMLLIAGALLAMGSAAVAKPSQSAPQAAKEAAPAAAPAATDAAKDADKGADKGGASASDSNDLFLAQREVRVSDHRDTVFTMGKDVAYEGADAKTIVTMGEKVRFTSGQARDKLVAMGETVDVGSGFKVQGDAVAMGKTVTVSAPIGGDLNVAGETVTIDSVVAGSVKGEADHLIIGPNARIGGDLKYRTDNLEISPQAVITGKQTKLVGSPHRRGLTGPKTPMDHAVGILWGALVTAVLAFGSTLLLPGLVGRAGDSIAKNPLMPLAFGLVALFGVPLLIVICAITLIGLPVAIMLGLLYGAAFFLAFGAMSNTIGGLIRGVVAKSKDAPGFGGRLGWAVLGGVVLSLLGAIPVAGGWITLAACVLGLGGVVLALRKA